MTPSRDLIWRTRQEQEVFCEEKAPEGEDLPRPTQYQVATKAGILSLDLTRGKITRLEFLATPWERLHQETSELEMENVPSPESQYATEKHAKWLRRMQTWSGGDALGVPSGVLEQEGTPFQLAVWAAVQKIPCGETRTYEALAAQLNSSARAVAGACAANTLALWVPCHRVVPKRGGPGKYKWGDWRKARLLDLEQSDGS